MQRQAVIIAPAALAASPVADSTSRHVTQAASSDVYPIHTLYSTSNLRRITFTVELQQVSAADHCAHQTCLSANRTVDQHRRIL